MGGPGDILEEFDDESLRRSIEAADKDGQWKDANARFVDPRLQDLAKRLAEVPRANYTERRLQELDRRAAEKVAKTAVVAKEDFPPPAEPPPPPQPAAAMNDDWRETVMRQPAPNLPAEPALPARDLPVPSGSAVDWTISLGAAVAVFGAAVGIQGAVIGWTGEMGLRALAAAIVTGCAWQWFGGGRFRIAAIGLAVHLLAFVSTSQSSTGTETFATLLGGLVVLLGSGAVGLSREEDSSSARPRKS